MKKILLIPFLLFAALSMTACGSGTHHTEGITIR